MRLNPDDTLSLSPSDLSNHLACPHLTTLSLAAARGEIVKPKLDSPHRDLIFRKGNEHEAAYLARLEAEGRSVVRIPTYDDEEFDADEAQRLTEEAIRAGDGRRHLPAVPHRRNVARLRRLPRAAARRRLRARRHEARAQRQAGPRAAAAFYAEQVARISGRPVERVHVENGLGERETFRVVEFEAYYRRVRERFLAAIADEPRDVRLAERATAGSATSGTCAGSSASTTTTSRSSRGCGARTPRR